MLSSLDVAHDHLLTSEKVTSATFFCKRRQYKCAEDPLIIHQRALPMRLFKIAGEVSHRFRATLGFDAGYRVELR